MSSAFAEELQETPGGGDADDDAVETGLCKGAYVGKLCYNSWAQETSGWKWVYVPFNGRQKVKYDDIKAINTHGAVTGISGNTYADLPGCVEAGAEGFYVQATFWYEMDKNSAGNFYAKRHTNSSGQYEMIGPFVWNTVWGGWNGGPTNPESNIEASWGDEHTVPWTQVQKAYEMGRAARSEMKGDFKNGAFSTVCAWETAGGVQSNTRAWIKENGSQVEANWEDHQTNESAQYTINLGKVKDDQCAGAKTDMRQDKEVEVHLASMLKASNASDTNPAKTEFRIRHVAASLPSGVTITGDMWNPGYGPQEVELKDTNEHHLPTEYNYNKAFKIKIPKGTPSGSIVKICEYIDYKKTAKSTTYDGETHACAEIQIVSEEETIPPCPNKEICAEINGIEMGGPNFGNTMGDTYVKNYSSTQAMRTMISSGNRLDGDGFLDTWVFAKPGDSIQFRHRLCSGAMEVSGTSGYEDRDNDDGVGKWPSAGNPYNYGIPSHDYSAVNYKFAIQAEPNRKYAFGNSIKDSWVNDGPPGNWVSVNGGPASGAQYTPLSPQSPVYHLPAKDRNAIGFRVYSPSVDAGSKYKCSPLYTLSRDGWFSPGYQVPGFTNWPSMSGTCGAVNNTDGDSYRVGVGKTTTQRIYWNNIVGFEQLKGLDIISGVCTPGNCHSAFGTDTRRSTSWNRFTNTKNNPHAYRYGEYEAVKAAAGPWGWHKAGCSYTTCSYSCCSCPPCDEDGCSCGTCCTWTYVTGNSDPWYKPVYWYDHTRYQGKQYEQDDATVYTPFNFTTDKTISITNTPVIYGGSSVSTNWRYEVLPKQNVFTAGFKYATVTPRTSRMQVVEFLLSPDATGVKAGNDNVAVTDVCTYFGASECAVIQEDGRIKNEVFNPTGDYDGWKRSGARTRTVPDVEVGTKYCTAIGVYPADSTNRQAITADSSGIALLKGLGMEGGNTWNISNAVCRTIAKKPTFQVWNGGLWTPSAIITSISKKEVGAALGHDYDEGATKIFGSWSEQTLVVNGDIWGMASGAGVGYNGWSSTGGKYEYNFALRGGVNSGTTHKQVSNLTISNTGGTMGNSGITSLSSTILTRLKARYMNIADHSVSDVNGSGLEYRRYSGSVNLGSIVKTANETAGHDNTLIIQVDGTAIINSDICYGSCVTGPLTTEFGGGERVNGAGTKLENYSMTAKSISALPQILIFANDILIAHNVTHVDAWLIADSGVVDTCYDQSAATSRVCHDPLVVNGPVFAQSLYLNRTAGSWPGAGTQEGGGVLKQNLANDGSITPGEIFNLRSDVYLWAYNQAQRYTEAVVTYSRELAPRY